jgi:serine/threonine-protein kinase HSL1, negative regulator of Swe1 kinase
LVREAQVGFVVVKFLSFGPERAAGRVKLARHVKTHQYAAIKIVSKTALINSRISVRDVPAHAEKVLLSIEREIVIMKLIDHPNVLSLYDVWETASELYV